MKSALQYCRAGKQSIEVEINRGEHVYSYTSNYFQTKYILYRLVAVDIESESGERGYLEDIKYQY